VPPGSSGAIMAFGLTQTSDRERLVRYAGELEQRADGREAEAARQWQPVIAAYPRNLR